MQVLVCNCFFLSLSQITARLLYAVVVSEVTSTFYKINVHAALTPEQIWGHLQPAIEQANSLREAYEHGKDKEHSLRLPFVTVCHTISLYQLTLVHMLY